MLWPVINPLSRYRYAMGLNASAEPPKWSGHIPAAHDTYWVTEDAMEEGNPMLALERGEAVATPPALWIQGQPDAVHDYVDTGTGQQFAPAATLQAGALHRLGIEGNSRGAQARDGLEHARVGHVEFDQKILAVLGWHIGHSVRWVGSVRFHAGAEGEVDAAPAVGQPPRAGLEKPQRHQPAAGERGAPSLISKGGGG